MPVGMHMSGSLVCLHLSCSGCLGVLTTRLQPGYAYEPLLVGPMYCNSYSGKQRLRTLLKLTSFITVPPNSRQMNLVTQILHAAFACSCSYLD